MSQYFKDRASAGLELANQLAKLRYENVAVLALSAGSVLVAEQIASQLHAVLMMLLIEDINLSVNDPTIVGTLDPRGEFMYNKMYSAGELEEWTTEFHSSIEESKLSRFQHMHRLLGENGIVDDKLLYGRTVILVSSGLKTGLSAEAAANYLKPIHTERIVAAVPVASVAAVDRLHIITDEIHCLSVVEQYLDTNHYYDNNDVPSTEEVITKINEIISNWQ